MWGSRKKTYETAEEYEKALIALKEKLQVFTDNSGGDFSALEKEAIDVLGVRDTFPEVYERYRGIEPMMGDIMSERVRSRSFRQGMSPKGN